MDSLIPTQNPNALSSYYMGLFSILPLLGLLLGPLAILNGRKGIGQVKAEPQMPGKTHAYVGIGCGSLGLLFNLMIVGIVVAALLSR